MRVGDLSFGTGAIFDMDTLRLRWFRRVLQGEPAAWPFKGRIRLFVTGRDEWRDEDEWPPPGAVEHPLLLAGGGEANTVDGAGRLRWEAPGGPAVDEFVHAPDDPVPTAGGAHMIPEAMCPAGPIEQRPVQRRQDVLVIAGTSTLRHPVAGVSSGISRRRAAEASPEVSRPLRTARRSMSSTKPSALPTDSGRASQSSTVWPAVAAHWAMPRPITPVPTTLMRTEPLVSLDAGGPGRAGDPLPLERQTTDLTVPESIDWCPIPN
ncbi:hypothetical protein GCM10017673_29400 [Streptosporangium violaceochromogenes]|nr:hypothetical protein GCM10017673_29400 [Streptosporangium violaceochromogenes]